MNIYQAYLIVAIVALLTFSFRFLPFAFYQYLQHSKTLSFIRIFLPASIMLLLSIYTLKDVALTVPPYGLSEGIGVFTVIFLHLKYRNALLSIALGTILYILCKNFLVAY